MENFYNSLQKQEQILEFIEIDGLILSAEQMQKIANDKMVLVEWRGEWIHLCRCEPISYSESYDICYSTNWSPNLPILHIHRNGKTLCGNTVNDAWCVERKNEWIRRCKSCESLIDKES